MVSSFLWEGQLHGWSMVAMSKPEIEGGVGLRSVSDMTRAASLKRLWNCCTSQSIWARWMNMHYVKEKSFWEAKVNPMDSDMWKNIAHMRPATNA